MSIKYLAEDDRPREKFLLKGRNSLSDSELLAIIMGSGSRNESVVELARRILDSTDNSWHKLSLLTVSDLMKFNGVGEAKAISIAAALEIGRRKASQEIPEDKIIKSSMDSDRFFRPHLSDLRTEQFWAVFLNNNNKVVHHCQLTSGGISQSVVDVRVLFRTAIEHYATGLIVAHNHPGGSLKASQEDLSITKQIQQGGKILNIKLLDHLIITQGSYLSFADEGLI